MSPLEDFTRETFAGRLGETFHVQPDEQTPALDLVLSELTELEKVPGLEYARAPFSLLLHGPPEPVLPQRTYRLRNDALEPEPFDLFIVPVGPDDKGMQYEAVFT